MEVSVVIPTHNRRELLRSVLLALERQEPEAPPFEVIVVADGCTDGTADMIRAWTGPLMIRVMERPGSGPAAARNEGAAVALAPVLLFLDDDVLPEPQLVGAHAKVHLEQPGGVVIGPYPPASQTYRDPFRRHVRSWWKAHFNELSKPGHRFRYSDVLTGNLSLSQAVWNKVGGLDPQFAYAREDLELGVRLMQAQVRFHYAPNARGWHHEHSTSSISGAIRRSREEGHSDARMALKHPHLGPVLAVVRSAERGRHRLARIVLQGRKGRALDFALPAGILLARMLNRLNSRHFFKIYGLLQVYAYHRGATTALNGHWWRIRVDSDQGSKPHHIDLAGGIERAEDELTRVRPALVRVTYGQEEIGLLPENAGAERWAGHHLRQALLDYMPQRMIAVLLLTRSMVAPHLKCAPTALSRFGSRGYDILLQEALGQWRDAGL